jgi:ABC-type sulfate/molybdate transport systems ATPase subunit
MNALYVHLETRLRDAMLDVTLEVDNELMALVGPERSGKSVILRSVAGVYVPDSGLVSIQDRTVFSTGLGVNLPAAERRVGYLPQQHALFPHLNVADNIAYPLERQTEWSPQRMSERVNDMLDLMGLQRHSQAIPDDLSGEDRLRVAIARALSLDPDVLLLDDPFATLEDDVRRRVRSDFAQLRRQIGIPALLATSQLDEAYEVADRIALLDRGRIAQVDTPPQLLTRPRNRRVAELVSAVNVIAGTVVRTDGTMSEVRTAFGLLIVAGPAGTDGEVDLVIRPENIRILEEQRDWRTLTNVVHGHAAETNRHGATYSVVFAAEHDDAWDGPTADLHIFLSSLAYQQLDLSARPSFSVELPPDLLHVMPRSLDVERYWTARDA